MGSDLWQRITALLAAQHGVVAWRQLQDLGVRPRQCRWLLERGDLVATERREIYRTPVVAPDEHQRVMAAVLAAGEEAIASHITAAALHGVAGFRLNGATVHVTVAHGRHPDGPKATLHFSRALPASHVAERDGIPVTTAARTLLDLGRLLRPARVERALDDALAAGLVTTADVERVLHDLAGPGRAGTKLMRELLEERGDGFVAPRSRLERRFLDLVRAEQLPDPRREVDLGTETEWNGRVEFVFDPAVLVEIDGRRWHTALLDMERDDQRDNVFRSEGFIVLRFRYRTLRDRPAVVAERIRRAIETASRQRAARDALW